MRLLTEGQALRGTYEVERLLGEGAFGEVYRVKHRFLGRQAMKIFKAAGMETAEVEELLVEAVLLSRLGHPNIVRVFDAGVIETPGGVLGYFTMEYVAGGSLYDFWRSHGNKFVPVSTVVEIARQICRGLAVAHGERPPIVHRDVKPQNILVGYDGAGIRVRLSDFGLAKHVNPLTLLASGRGTPAFKPPEVFLNAGNDSCAADVWSLGATIYLLLTDRLPFEAEGESPSLERFNRPLIPPHVFNVDVDSDLEEVVRRSLALRPEERHPDARALLSDLERWEPGRMSLPVAKKGIDASPTRDKLGADSVAFDEEAERSVREALALAKGFGKLSDAADLLERAFALKPGLRQRYEYQLQLWRRGVAM
ncbi:MAG: serine/threonine-protein kinase [Actinomycetota bacterium]|nr:serine/threonine-protein kinase [Actinomycetota bacterium]